MVDIDYCLSSFFLYRRVVDPDKEFVMGRKPKSIPTTWDKVGISSSYELENYLREQVSRNTKDGKAALALSGGIDSAILAKMMPKGSVAYTFKCTAGNNQVVDETIQASKYAQECGLEHRIIEVTWDDMEKYSPLLMKNKCSPMHSIEVQIYMGGLEAKKAGFDKIIYGETADVNYGGLSNILSRDWHMGEFIERYAYVKPWFVLKNPKIDFSYYEKYSEEGMMDVHRFLAEFDIIESVNSYVNACEVAGIKFVAPFANTYLSVPLDYERVRNGENKYLIREIFKKLYPGWEIPQKIPMPRPVDIWLKDWKGPTRNNFIPKCVDLLTGDQKWLVWAANKYLEIMGD